MNRSICKGRPGQRIRGWLCVGPHQESQEPIFDSRSHVRPPHDTHDTRCTSHSTRHARQARHAMHALRTTRVCPCSRSSSLQVPRGHALGAHPPVRVPRGQTPQLPMTTLLRNNAEHPHLPVSRAHNSCPVCGVTQRNTAHSNPSKSNTLSYRRLPRPPRSSVAAAAHSSPAKTRHDTRRSDKMMFTSSQSTCGLLLALLCCLLVASSSAAPAGDYAGWQPVANQRALSRCLIHSATNQKTKNRSL